MTSPSDRLRSLADELTASETLTHDWRAAFLSVPRHAFIPEVIWREDGKTLVPLLRTDDPKDWLELAYGHHFVITQVDDGRPLGPGLRGGEISSSASRPDVVALMLAALHIEEGMTVCEIGTGTGYNAALLAARLGDENVTTIEVDPELAARARRSLTAAGHEVTVVTGDGAAGYPPRAPYDRIIATAAVQQVPYPWIAQTRPGGRRAVGQRLPQRRAAVTDRGWRWHRTRPHRRRRGLHVATGPARRPNLVRRHAMR